MGGLVGSESPSDGLDVEMGPGKQGDQSDRLEEKTRGPGVKSHGPGHCVDLGRKDISASAWATPFRPSRKGPSILTSRVHSPKGFFRIIQVEGDGVKSLRLSGSFLCL